MGISIKYYLNVSDLCIYGDGFEESVHSDKKQQYKQTIQGNFEGC